MSDKLKPCPFCGSKANTGHWNGNKKHDSYYVVMCTHCFARTVGETVEEAIESWNRRTVNKVNNESLKLIKPPFFFDPDNGSIYDSGNVVFAKIYDISTAHWFLDAVNKKWEQGFK